MTAGVIMGIRVETLRALPQLEARALLRCRRGNAIGARSAERLLAKGYVEDVRAAYGENRRYAVLTKSGELLARAFLAWSRNPFDAGRR